MHIQNSWYAETNSCWVFNDGYSILNRNLCFVLRAVGYIFLLTVTFGCKSPIISISLVWLNTSTSCKFDQITCFCDLKNNFLTWNSWILFLEFFVLFPIKSQILSNRRTNYQFPWVTTTDVQNERIVWILQFS